MTVAVRGVVHVTGLHGVGKTVFGLTCTEPERLLVLDYERSAEGFVAEYPVGEYHNIEAECVPSGLNPYRRTLAIVSGLEEGRFEAALLDNTSNLESAIHDEIVAKPDRYGLSPAVVERAGPLVWGIVKQEFERLRAMLLARGIVLTVITTHLREEVVQGPGGRLIRTGAYDIRGASRLEDASSLTLWLVRVPGQDVPAALVLKERLGLPVRVRVLEQDRAVIVSAGGKEDVVGGPLRDLVARRVAEAGGKVPTTVVLPRLPRRLPRCTWDAIREYMADPTRAARPRPEEIPSEAEERLIKRSIDPALAEAIRLARLAAEEEAEARKAAEKAPSTVAELVERAGKMGLDIPTLLERVGAKSLGEIDVAGAWEVLVGGNSG